MLAEQGRTLDLGRGRRQLDRHADVPPFAALGVIDFDIHFAATHMLVIGQIFGRHDRAAGHVDRVQLRHQFALGVIGGKFVDQGPHQLLVLAALADGGEALILGQIGNADIGADAVGEAFPHRFLHHDVQIIVGAMRLAMNRVAELATAGIVTRARHFAHALIGRHRILGQCAALQALVIAEFDAAQVHHAVHHRHFHILADAGAVALMQGAEQADGQMQAGTGIADLRPGDKRCAVRHAGGAHRAAHRLRDVFIGLEIRVRAAGAEALDRTHHDARVDLVNFFPGEAEAIEHAGAEVFHHDVALLQQVDEHFLALRRFHVHRDRALVAIEHGEIQRIRTGHIAQLAARGIALGRLELDHISTHPGQQLRAGRAGLDVSHVENSYVFKRFHSFLLKFFGRGRAAVYG